MANITLDWRKLKIIFTKGGGRCYYCGEELPEDTKYYDANGYNYRSDRNWDVDHIHPHSKGGCNKNDNLAPACKRCNAIKRDKSLEEFRAVFFSPLATDHRFYFEREDLHQ